MTDPKTARVCVVCGNVFYSSSSRARYCCKKCSNRSRYPRSLGDIKDRQHRILELAEKGETVEKIAKELGYKSVSSVVTYLRKNEFPVIYEAGKRRRQRDEQIVSLRKNGYSMTAICKEMGLNIGQVWKICTDQGYGGIRAEMPVQEMRFCKECNTVFFCDTRSNQLFCSEKCQRKNNHKKHDLVRRARKFNAIVDRDIALKDLAEKENDVCYLCGEKVDWNDYKIINGKKYTLGRYPSIDHVVPLINGGKHSWDNVRLAHIRCNSSKGAGKVG